MTEEGEPKSVPLSELQWEKVEDYADRYAEIVTVNANPRSVILDFGIVDHTGKKGETSVHPHVDFHTRLRMSPEHYVSMVKVFVNVLAGVKKGMAKTLRTALDEEDLKDEKIVETIKEILNGSEDAKS